MKTNYVAPQIEVIEIYLEEAVLAISGNNESYENGSGIGPAGF